MTGRKKTWYAASVVMFFRLKSGRQKKFSAWENVYLIASNSPEEAMVRAEELGQGSASTSDEGVTWGGKPADIVFGGVRKLLTCAADPASGEMSPVTKLHDGVEATYSTFTVKSRAELDALIRGDAVSVLYDED